VHWVSAVGPLISRVPGQKGPHVGESADLHASFTKLHFFDPATEQALDGAGVDQSSPVS